MSGQVGYKGQKYIWGESWKRNDKFEYTTVCNSSGEIYMEEITRALPGNVRTLCALLNLKNWQRAHIGQGRMQRQRANLEWLAMHCDIQRENLQDSNEPLWGAQGLWSLGTARDIINPQRKRRFHCLRKGSFYWFLLLSSMFSFYLFSESILHHVNPGYTRCQQLLCLWVPSFVFLHHLPF